MRKSQQGFSSNFIRNLIRGLATNKRGTYCISNLQRSDDYAIIYQFRNTWWTSFWYLIRWQYKQAQTRGECLIMMCSKHFDVVFELWVVLNSQYFLQLMFLRMRLFLVLIKAKAKLIAHLGCLMAFQQMLSIKMLWNARQKNWNIKLVFWPYKHIK